MSWNRHRRPQDGGSAPATPGFIAVAPEWLIAYGAADAAPVIPAAESTLGSHPCAALSSAQVLPEWINHNPAVHAFASGSANPLTSCLSPGVHFTSIHNGSHGAPERQSLALHLGGRSRHGKQRRVATTR